MTIGSPGLPLSGSDTYRNTSCSWTFTPGSPICPAKGDRISVTLNPDDRTMNNAALPSGLSLPANPSPNSAAPSCTPFAIAKSIPDKAALVTTQIKLDGTKSFDPNPADSVVGFEWTKTKPPDEIAPNTLSNPTSPTPTFDIPDYIPARFTSLTTPPELLPLEFSLVVADTHGAKSTNEATASIKVECNAADQAKAEKARDFINQIINPTDPFKSQISKKLYPQAIENFGYWLHGKGDTQGLPEGITGKGVPKPVSVDWLYKATEFRLAQATMLHQIKLDISKQLAQMKPGETSKFVPSQNPYSYDITNKQKGYVGIPGARLPTDFTVAVGAANTYAYTDLMIQKHSSIFGTDYVSGKITLQLKDIYDFNSGITFNVPFVGKITADELHQAIKCLGARNFNEDTTYSKILTNVPVGRLTIDGVECEFSGINDCKIEK